MDKFWGISATKLGKANQWPSGDIFSDRSMAMQRQPWCQEMAQQFQLSMTCDDLPKHPVQGVLAIIFTGIWQAGKGWQSRFDKGVVHGYGKAGLLRGYPWCSSIESILSRLSSWWMIIGGYLYDITRYIWGWLNRTKKMIPDWDPPMFPNHSRPRSLVWAQKPTSFVWHGTCWTSGSYLARGESSVTVDRARKMLIAEPWRMLPS